MTTSEETVQLIAALIGGRDRESPEPPAVGAESDFLAQCSTHGVSSLVHEAVKQRRDWPPSLREALRRQNMEGALRQGLDDQEIVSLLPRLSAAGVEPLLLKGAAYAHLVYARPQLRPREDTDLLIRPGQLDQTRNVLTDLGYQELPSHSGQLIMFQKSYRRELVSGHWHTLDVHWKISNAHVFTETFCYEELDSRAIRVASLGPRARTLSLPDSLLHACLHRVGHHQGSLRMIWLYDIWRLAEAIGSGTMEEFQRLAQTKGLLAVCLDGLRAARFFFDSEALDQLVASLASRALHGGREPGAELVGGKKSRRRVLWSDFKSQPSLRRKLQWTRENLFPPRSHVLPGGEPAGRLKLLGRYFGRAARGLWRVATEGRTRKP